MFSHMQRTDFLMKRLKVCFPLAYKVLILELNIWSKCKVNLQETKRILEIILFYLLLNLVYKCQT